MGYPLGQDLDDDGVPPSGPGWEYLPHWDWMRGTPVGIWMGVSPPLPRLDGTWTGYVTGGTPLAVSRRRTFLFNKGSIFFSNQVIPC